MCLFLLFLLLLLFFLISLFFLCYSRLPTPKISPKNSSMAADSRSLGRRGNFSEVRYSMPDSLHIFQEDIKGPAYSRQLYRDGEEGRTQMKAKELSETEEEKIKRRAKEKREATKAKHRKIKEDWRTNQIKGARDDTDFLKQISDVAAGDRKKQKAAELLKLGPHLFPSHIGPKTRAVNYDRAANNIKVLAKGTTVREQLEGRVVEEVEWETADVDGKPMSQNR